MKNLEKTVHLARQEWLEKQVDIAAKIIGIQKKPLMIWFQHWSHSMKPISTSSANPSACFMTFTLACRLRDRIEKPTTALKKTNVLFTTIISKRKSTMETITKTRHQHFCDDMEDAGFEVRDYHGRFFYHGPAAVVDRDQLQDAIRATSVPLQWDNFGRDWIVYPTYSTE